MIKQFKIYFILVLINLTLLEGQNYASFAGGFLRMGSSARSMAMGSGFTAEIDAGFAAYHNPASMVFLKKSFTILIHCQMKYKTCCQKNDS